MSKDLGFIHRFEAGPKPDAPTVLLLHGTGGGEDDLLGIGRSIAPDANLLSPRGKSLDEGMPRFFRRFAEGKFDEADIIRRASELAKFVADAAVEYGFEAKRVVAMGYSNGANNAAAVILLHPRVLAGAMLLRAMVPLAPEKKPDLSGKSMLMCSAANDPIVPGENTLTLAALLKNAGADVALQWMNSGHGLSQDDLTACAEWYQKLVT
jgi:phospholipase/carboxylesterase